MAGPAAGPANPRPQPDVTALAAALSLDDHAALHEASTPAVLRVVIAAYGGAGSPALLAALVADGHLALWFACARDDWPGNHQAWITRETQAINRLAMLDVLIEAYGGLRSVALSDALADVGGRCLLAASRLADAPLIALLIEAFGGPGSEGLLAALASGDAFPTRHARHAALLSVGEHVRERRLNEFYGEDFDTIYDVIHDAKRELLAGYGERGVAGLVAAAAAEGGEQVDAFLCAVGDIGDVFRYAMRCPVAWQPGSGGRQPLARRMRRPVALKPAALPVVCAVCALPKGVAGPILAFLRQRPWLLYAAERDCPCAEYVGLSEDVWDV